MNKVFRVLATALLAAAGLSQAFAQPAAVPPNRPAFPGLVLPDAKAGGQRAIDVLGDRLPEVAAWYGVNPLVFRSILLRDRTNKIDRNGRWFVEEEFQAPAVQESPEVINGTLAPLADTFKLQSKPGASRTVYLNFRGATLTGTAWNSNGNTLIAQPFHMTGEGAADTNFTNNELTRIQYIWQRVAEDFAPFDVNVTTQQPAADALTRSSSSDTTFGTTALITNRTGVYSCSCGGVAYVGIYANVGDFYKPALVFWDALGSGEKSVAEAISHEVGHNVGLSHDGTSAVGYYEGHGSGTTGWAPIMGVGYYQNLVQWSKGEYAGANQTQDDIQVIQNTGMPLRADDHGNTTGTATGLTGSSSGGVTSLRGEGVIERSTDIDYFSFTAGAGSATFTLSPAARSANLDGLMKVYDSAGTQITSANPVDLLNASVTVTLPTTGTYYVSVQGTGKGDVLGTGYSSYGSLGFYAMTASVPTGGAGGLPPVAVISANPLSGTAPLTVNFSGSGSSDPDGTVMAWAWNFGNGATGSGASTSATYSNAGNYTAQLVVTDNSGNTGATTVSITVTPPVQPMWVGDLTMGLNANKRNTSARASVTVKGGSGVLLPGAVVTGQWSGSVSGSASATAASNGVASFTSPTTRVLAGSTFTFTVTGITLNGYQYTPASNVKSSAMITR